MYCEKSLITIIIIVIIIQREIEERETQRGTHSGNVAQVKNFIISAFPVTNLFFSSSTGAWATLPATILLYSRYKLKFFWVLAFDFHFVPYFSYCVSPQHTSHRRFHNKNATRQAKPVYILALPFFRADHDDDDDNAAVITGPIF